MKKFAVVLSGCGVNDGAEIHESVLTLLALAQAGVQYQCVAPNIPQLHVINHLTSSEQAGAERNVLEESARIARGDILDIAEADPDKFDGILFPGGFGAAKNLCDFAMKGSECEVNKDVQTFAQAFVNAQKPLGFICISPAMIPLIVGTNVSLTIGNDMETANTIKAMGGKHIDCTVEEIVTDEKHKIVSTPAYMLAQSIAEAHTGIDKLVKKVIQLS